MNGERSLWIARGLVISGLSTVVLSTMAMSGFGAGASGDIAVSSNPMPANLMIAVGAAALLGLEFAHTRRHRPSRVRRIAPAREAAEA